MIDDEIDRKLEKFESIILSREIPINPDRGPSASTGENSTNESHPTTTINVSAENANIAGRDLIAIQDNRPSLKADHPHAVRCPQCREVVGRDSLTCNATKNCNRAIKAPLDALENQISELEPKTIFWVLASVGAGILIVSYFGIDGWLFALFVTVGIFVIRGWEAYSELEKAKRERAKYDL